MFVTTIDNLHLSFVVNVVCYMCIIYTAMSKSSVNSKFKAPKKASESSTGLKQLDLLSQFGYSR